MLHFLVLDLMSQLAVFRADIGFPSLVLADSFSAVGIKLLHLVLLLRQLLDLPVDKGDLVAHLLELEEVCVWSVSHIHLCVSEDEALYILQFLAHFVKRLVRAL